MHFTTGREKQEMIYCRKPSLTFWKLETMKAIVSPLPFGSIRFHWTETLARSRSYFRLSFPEFFKPADVCWIFFSLKFNNIQYLYSNVLQLLRKLVSKLRTSRAIMNIPISIAKFLALINSTCKINPKKKIKQLDEVINLLWDWYKMLRFTFVSISDLDYSVILCCYDKSQQAAS